jgi:hypothetical protein
MRKLLLATAVLGLLAFAAPVHADTMRVCPQGAACEFKSDPTPQPTQSVPVPVPVPVPTPQPMIETWWIYNWVHCYDDDGNCVVNITVDGLNVRDNNNNIQFAVVNGTPVHIFDRNGRWLHVTIPCQLVPTGLWSDTVGVPLLRCQ